MIVQVSVKESVPPVFLMRLARWRHVLTFLLPACVHFCPETWILGHCHLLQT